MKKYVSLFLALIISFTLASCGGRTDENITASVPVVAAERTAVEQAGAIATQTACKTGLYIGGVIAGGVNAFKGNSIKA